MCVCMLNEWNWFWVCIDGWWCLGTYIHFSRFHVILLNLTVNKTVIVQRNKNKNEKETARTAHMTEGKREAICFITVDVVLANQLHRMCVGHFFHKKWLGTTNSTNWEEKMLKLQLHRHLCEYIQFQFR